MTNFDCSYQFIYHEYKCNKIPIELIEQNYKEITPDIISDVIENFKPNACLICLLEPEDKHTDKDKVTIKLLETEIKLENLKRFKYNSEKLHYNVMLKNQNKILINLLDEIQSNKTLDCLNIFSDG